MVYGLWFGFTVQSCSWPDSRGDGFGSGSEAGSYLRLIDSCITQLKAEGPARTCNGSKEEEKKKGGPEVRGSCFFFITLEPRVE